VSYADANREKARLEAEAKPVRRHAELRQKLVPDIWGNTAAAVQSSCCAVEMGFLDQGGDGGLFWNQPRGWTQDDRGYWHTRPGRENRARQHGDSHYRHALPIVLRCPQCDTPQRLPAEGLKLPRGMDKPWREERSSRISASP
jgi:hypothetical protein